MNDTVNQEEKSFFSVKNLRVSYRSGGEIVHAVNGVSFSLKKGETIGLVGETGAGKTTVALSIMNLLPDRVSKIEKGEVIFDGRSVLNMSKKELMALRGKKISMIFQDPMTSLNPVIPLGDQVAEVFRLHNEEGLTKAQINEKVDEVFRMVGISPSRKHEYPHQFSGGMKQRVVIAMALCCNPELLIADEPTTALDVTIQAQVMDMIADLQKQLGTAMILITHDLGIVVQSCDYVAIMYAGSIVEIGTTEQIFDRSLPHHPYTDGLFGAIPNLADQSPRLKAIHGLMPDPTNLPTGCTFHPRCEHCIAACSEAAPEAYEKDGHRIYCHLYHGEDK